MAVLKLISAYRVLGSRWANLDPAQRMDQSPVRELDPSTHGLSDADMAVQFNTGSLVGQQKKAAAVGNPENLKQTYCGNIGLEYTSNSEQSTGSCSALEADLSTRVSARTPKSASSNK